MKTNVSKFSKFATLLIVTLLFILGGSFLSRSASADSAADYSIKRDIVGQNGITLPTDDYLNFYSIPSSHFAAVTNGGAVENHPLDLAFDRNFGTFWQATQLFNAEKPSSTSYIDVNFDRQVSINRILFQVVRSNYLPVGHPDVLRIYTKNAGDKNFVLKEELNEYSTSNLLLYTFDTLSCTSLRFEYANITSTGDYGYPSCCEMIFLQPETEETGAAYQALGQLFSDYNEFTLNTSYNSKQAIESLREAVKDLVAYDDFLAERLNRADQILNHVAIFDPRREMSTLEGAQKPLQQFGNIKDYASSVLDMVWFGTNRQSTGIYMMAGDTLTVYVDAEPDEANLPSIQFSQFNGTYGEWWNKRSFPLQKGKNVIVAPDYSAGIKGLVKGGAVYILNPYTSESQSDIKVYFEGGEVLPVFHKGDDQSQYLAQLASFVEFQQANSNYINDMTELVSDHFIMTVRASVAKEIYIDEGKSPQKNLEYWDDYMEKVLVFDGVVFDEAGHQKYPSQDLFKNRHINCNIRIAQPYGAAYAYADHVGIQMDGWERTAIYTELNGWGFTHELGHMMDISERTVSECSNNMMSKYSETALEKAATRGDFDKTTAALSPDNHIRSFWNTGKLNFLVWWLLESYMPGYWSEFENLYRFYNFPEDLVLNQAASTHWKTEKQVYFSSLIFKKDLSYYFERWGYNFGEDNGEYVFEYNTASSTFKSLMEKAKAENKILDAEPLKFWYLDAKEYLQVVEGNTALYNNSDIPEIREVTKTHNGYNLIVSSTRQSDPSHLGFEIIETTTNKVVGFTHSGAFLDTNAYSGTPNYKAIAYDRALGRSRESAAKSVTELAYVCRVEDKNYKLIADAVRECPDNSTIYLFKNTTESGIEINKNITIQLDDKVGDVTILRAGYESVFVVRSSGSLTLNGNEQHKIILDGANFLQDDPLIKFLGNLTLNYVTLQDNKVKEKGGALLFASEDSEIKNLVANHVVIKNNSAKYGGAIYNDTGRLITNFNDCTFTGNSAENGGAVVNIGGAIFNFKNCVFTGNHASGKGGAFYCDSKTTLNGCTLTENTAAVQGGAIYFSSTMEVRTFDIGVDTPILSTLSNNTAPVGSAIYSERGNLNLYYVSVDGTNSGEYPVYINGGRVTFNLTDYESSLDCKLYKGFSATILLNYKTITLDIFAERATDGMVLVSANFDLDNPSMFTVNQGGVSISEDRRHALSRIESHNVHFSFGESEETQMIEDGAFATLPDTESTDRRYVESWSGNGGSYNVGDKVKVEGDMNFTASLGEKHSITISLPDQTNQVYYVRPGADFILPNLELAGFKLLNYTRNNVVYLPFATIKSVSQSMTFNAVCSNAINLTISKNGEPFKTIEVEFNKIVYLSNLDLELPVDKEVYRWSVDDKPCSTETLAITKSTALNAEIGQKRIYLNYYYNDEFNNTVQKFYGDKFVLSTPRLPEGYDFDHYEIDGKQVELGTEITLTQNLDIKIVMHKSSAVTTAIIVAVCMVVLAIAGTVAMVILKNKGKARKQK